MLFVGSWSASTSPARSPSPTGDRQYHNSRYGPFRSSHKGFGTTSLCQRSRSPSPSHKVPHQHGPPTIGRNVEYYLNMTNCYIGEIFEFKSG